MMSRSLFAVCLMAWVLNTLPLCAEPLLEPSTSVPLIQDADVGVIGGGCSAVVAAEEAARSGAKVFLVTGDACLGEEDSYPISDTLLKLASHDVIFGN